jgi:hypothetical protein
MGLIDIHIFYLWLDICYFYHHNCYYHHYLIVSIINNNEVIKTSPYIIVLFIVAESSMIITDEVLEIRTSQLILYCIQFKIKEVRIL